ncbi:hypothetical protein KSP40_PGU006957 [Platanthera guangdongensis]|uniref:Uncharacterized protein n=1 Tax=Platanthera guangdongensis TaxID=2320717 RepID=A0ABR2LM39_9ASPA
MHRQSLGSPGSKVQIHDGGRGPVKEEKRKSALSPAAESSACTSEIDIKMEKPLRRPNPKSDTSIHLVPILILLCFTILYLCSHEPSSQDLTIFAGFSSLISHKDLIAAASTTEKAGGLGIRSHRALKEAGRNRHRKMRSP